MNSIDPNNFFEKITYQNLFNEIYGENPFAVNFKHEITKKQNSKIDLCKTKKEAIHNKSNSTPTSKVEIIKINKYLEEYYN